MKRKMITIFMVAMKDGSAESIEANSKDEAKTIAYEEYNSEDIDFIGAGEKYWDYGNRVEIA